MENGVEAFKIAAGMLIFVLAISITISAFTSATQALNRIFDMQNGDQYVTMTDQATGEEYYLNFVRFDGGTREVGAETIVPSIYRAYRENYSIYFYKKDASGTMQELYLYEKSNGEQVNYIDLEKEVYASADAAIIALKELLYNQNNSNYLNGNALYEYLTANNAAGEPKTFTEKLGEYYMDDLTGSAETAEVNKTKKRVIVYIENQ